MPRRKRQQSSTAVYHWICRGIHKMDLFHRAEDFEYFKALLTEHRESSGILIYHYCLMTNHVHLLIHSPTLEDMAKFSQLVQRRYAYYYCGKHHWVSNVFQRGYRSLPVEKDSHLLECGRYIERNPVKAGLSKNPADYRYSSYAYYAQAESDNLITPSPAYEGLSDNEDLRMLAYTEYVSESRTQDEMATSMAGLPF